MKFYKILLLPFSLLYGLIITLRNLFFDFGILPSESFPLPVITIGNLSTGGTGKTPHIEYLVRLLKDKYKIAVLSRGYGRRTSGFLLATENSTAKEVGDEPLQIKQKFPEITVSVCGSRVKGIKKLLKEEQKPDVILLDDAFQHRYVKASLSILLTDYSKLYTDDFLLPSGNLREFPSAAARADIIVVSKTPPIFSPLDRRFLLNKLNPKPYQKVYFSYTTYGHFMPLFPGNRPVGDNDYYFSENYSILLLTGIANAANMEYYLKNQAKEVRHLNYPDHHKYLEKDILQIRNLFDNIANDKKIILTTEKDAMRLKDPELKELTENLPIFYLPIEIKFHGDDEINFNDHIYNYAKKN
jgi:tetraacyldisaccharide 4'-kinase